MTTVIQNEQQINEQGGQQDVEAPAPIDPKVAKLMETNDTLIQEVVALAVETLDPRDALKKYAKLGARVLKHAAWQKSKFPAWAKEDYVRLCDKIADQVKFSVAIRDVRMDVYVRVHLFVEAVRPFCEGIEKLSYFQVANKFLPMLEFDAVDLTAEVKKGWFVFLKETLAQQIGPEPLSIKALDAKIAEQKAELERERKAKLDPEKAAEQERKAAESKARREREAAQSKVADAIDKALVDDHADPADVVQIVQKVLKDHKLEMPQVGIDPATCSKQDLKAFFSVMYLNGRAAELKFCLALLGKMVEQIETEAGAERMAS